MLVPRTGFWDPLHRSFIASEPIFQGITPLMAGKKDDITVIAVPTMLVTLSMSWGDGDSKAYHPHFSHFARGEGIHTIS